MSITSELVEDIFGIPRDGRNIQDDSEEELALDNTETKVSFAQKAAEIAADIANKVHPASDLKTAEKAVEIPAEKKEKMPDKPEEKKSAGMFGGIFDEDSSCSVSPAKPEPAIDPKPILPTVKVEAIVAKIIEKVEPKIEVQSKPVLPMPDPEPATVDFTESTKIVEDVVTEDDDSNEGPCEEWTSDDVWLLESPAPKYNKFYFEKTTAINAGSRSILPGGAINFTKYFNELADLNCDITVSTYDLEVIYQKMQNVQQLRERCKHIQLHASQQYYLWERYIELFHGILCRVEYERGKQDGIYYEHMRDMEHYYCSLKALHRNADQVMRTLDGAFECLSRQVTIAMPMKDIERFSGTSPAPRPIAPEQKKYDALGANTKPSVKNSQQGESGPIKWGQ